MPGPVALAPANVFHLNVRVPTALVDRLRGSRVDLPIDDRIVSAKLGDKVMVSLRTKDARIAKVRFSAAFAALSAHFAAASRGMATPAPGGAAAPVSAGIAAASAPTLTLKQAVALSGDAYRAMVDNGREDDPPDFAASEAAHAEIVAGCHRGDAREASAPLSADDAAFFADLQLPHGPALLTWRHGADLATPFFAMTHREALEELFGAEADRAVKRYGLTLDEVSRGKMLRQIGMATIFGTHRLKQTASGDFSPDPHRARFPSFDREPLITIAMVFERWREAKAGKVEASTMRRYTPSLTSLASFLKKKDVRHVTQDDIWEWAEHRRDRDGIAARTINRNDLVAAASVFTFATTRDGKRLRADSPVAGVRLEEPKRTRQREPFFRPGEIKAILTLARSVRSGRAHPRADASRRWVPWLCAYSGARVQEPCWLEKKHVQRDADTGIWVMLLPRTKTGNARTVPLHDALIEEGFLDFVAAAPEGFLFIDPGARKREVKTRTIQEQRASAIAEWISDHVDLEDGVDPNHGWRHTFITKATGKMDKRIQNAICGHNEKADVSDGYFTATIEEMKAGLDRFVKFVVD